MNVCVLGLWHLGTVTAACLAQARHQVIGLDFNPAVTATLSAGMPPLFEPGLEDLVRAGLAAGTLRFTAEASEALAAADVLWVAFDTPVDDEDRADVAFVQERVRRTFPYLRDGALVLISSQMPVGSTKKLEQDFAAVAGGRRVGFAYSPENLRLGKAIEVFTRPDRVVVGVRTDPDRARISELLKPLTDRVEWMSVESAEMTKHALNAFLAVSVTFINEIAAICEQVGADAGEVERGLKSEVRIGPKAYLSPGGAFAGGTLARDIVFLSQLGQELHVPAHVLSSVKTSNDAHRHWAERRLTELAGTLRGARVAVWGLTYKPGTNTLRRSSSVELCEWLDQQGAIVHAFDPAITARPGDLPSNIQLAPGALDAADGAAALVVATPWPQFRDLRAGEVASRMAGSLVLDASAFLGEAWARGSGLRYVSVGRGAS